MPEKSVRIQGMNPQRDSRSLRILMKKRKFQRMRPSGTFFFPIGFISFIYFIYYISYQGYLQDISKIHIVSCFLHFWAFRVNTCCSIAFMLY